MLLLVGKLLNKVKRDKIVFNVAIIYYIKYVILQSVFHGIRF